MKLINNILELIGATFIIAIALLITLYTQLELIYELGIIGLGTVLAIAMYILSTRYEKRLESELKASADMNVYWLSKKNEAENKVKELQTDLANQVKATEIKPFIQRVNNLNGDYTFSAEIVNGEIAAQLEMIPNTTPYETIPFADDSQPETQGYICPECNSSNVRETTHYVICNDCGKRKKKSTYGVKLTNSIE